MTFPIPFAGATMQFNASSLTHLHQAVEVLMRCSHDHNFLVQRDGLSLYCSPMAAQCLRLAYDTPVTIGEVKNPRNFLDELDPPQSEPG